MKYRNLIKKLNLNEQDFARIKDAIKQAESKTTGEIAIAVAPESAHYSFWELLAANIISALVFILLLPFSSKIHDFYESIYWHTEPSWVIPSFFIIACFLTIVIVFYLTNIPFIDSIIIPKAIKKVSVTQRAFRYFTESGVYKTKEHSGILIFVSYMEKEVRIIADQGLSKSISNDLWALIADDLAEDIKNKKTTDAFINAINRCGDLLTQYFPNNKEDDNELADGLIILGDAGWY